MRERGRNVGLVRCLKLMRELEGVRVRPPLTELAARHGVTTRTIYRDLQALQSAGIAIPKGYNPVIEAA